MKRYIVVAIVGIIVHAGTCMLANDWYFASEDAKGGGHVPRMPPMHLALEQTRRVRNQRRSDGAAPAHDSTSTAYSAKGIEKTCHIPHADLGAGTYCADIVGFVSAGGREYGLIQCMSAYPNNHKANIFVDVATCSIVHQDGYFWSEWHDCRCYGSSTCYCGSEAAMYGSQYCSMLLNFANGDCSMPAREAWSLWASDRAVGEFCTVECNTYNSDVIPPYGNSVCNNGTSFDTCMGSNAVARHCHWNATANQCKEDFAPIIVYDISDIDNGIVRQEPPLSEGVFETDTRRNTHNLHVDDDAARLYRCTSQAEGNTDCSTPSSDPYYCGVHMYDIGTDPAVPRHLKSFANNCHDLFTFTPPGTTLRIVALAPGYGPLQFWNVTDHANVTMISSVDYPGREYLHQCAWRHPYIYCNDELLGLSLTGKYIRTSLVIFDGSNIFTPSYVRSYSNGNVQTTHNAFVDDSHLYQSNYDNGLRVFDIQNGAYPTEIAHYDPHPTNTANLNFVGAWGVYVFASSKNAIVSDRTLGFYALKYVDCSALRTQWDTSGCCNDVYDETCASYKTQYKNVNCCSSTQRNSTNFDCFENIYAQNKYNQTCADVAANTECGRNEEGLWPTGESSNANYCRVSCGSPACASFAP